MRDDYYKRILHVVVNLFLLFVIHILLGLLMTYIDSYKATILLKRDNNLTKHLSRVWR